MVTSPGDSRSAKGRSSRLHSLDGLRGAAALVVLVHHSLLLFPSLATVYFPRSGGPQPGAWGWLLSYTPLHLVWAGTESVYLFFVLSGLVLVLPVLARPGFSWLAYYPRRVIRLYGPVLAAVLFGLLTYLLVPRYNDPVLGRWVNGRPNTYPASAVLVDATMVTGHSSRISPLWSLQWEVLFSLLLPLLVVLVRHGRRLDLLKAAALLALLVVGSVRNDGALTYLPMFAIGALTAARWRDIRSVVTAWAARWRPFWLVVGVVAVLLTSARWELLGLGVPAATADDLAFLAVPGVWLLVLLGWFSDGARSVLEAPLLQWAGRISFSLYLVHEPVIISARMLTPTTSPWVAVAIAVPLALAVAALFERFVESRFHRLAQLVGRAVQRRRRVLQPA